MISLLVVNYRSATLTAEAVRTARATTTAPLHVVIVDNSCDSAEAAQLRPWADTLLVSEINLGYAGAINAGRPACQGDTVIVANPDVIFLPGAIDRLVEALDDPHRAVAGPALYWDGEQQWILPPADARTIAEKLDEVAAWRSRAWAAWRDRRRVGARWDFWNLTTVTPVPAISGAVMAIRLGDFDAAGGFDERFRLYFEETDFLRRISRTGKQIVYVPAGRCRHIYNQSAGEDAAAAAELYAESEMRFWEKWYGRGRARLLLSMSATPVVPRFGVCDDTFRVPRENLLVEASPLPSFATAAGNLTGSTEVVIPPDVWRRYRSSALYLRAVDPETSRTVAACVRFRT